MGAKTHNDKKIRWCVDEAAYRQVQKTSGSFVLNSPILSKNKYFAKNKNAKKRYIMIL